MAYIALYRKWRPALFEDVVGQQHITATLQKAIETDKVAHAYLFSGPRGTGKTSTAKIFAKAMNCVHGPTPHPCNECEVCRHITDGESLDVVEIDAASNRSIEDIRTLRETIKFMPAEGHKKVYIIDEVHMLTTEAFNALLKTLEEPPAHVIFILATTEPEKIPMTILSRCQRYEFRRITSEDIAGRLLYVAGQEQFELTKGAAHILAIQADGGMRDALSMLDQCVSNATGAIDEGLVRNLLGLIGRDWLFTLATAVFAGQGDVIIRSIDEIVHMGKEPRVILTELATHLRAIMLYQADPHSDTLAAYADSMEQLAAQAAAVPAERVFAILAVLQQALLTARTSPTPRIAVEMGLLMASRTTGAASSAAVPALAAPAAVPQAILDRIARLEAALLNQGGQAVSAPVAPAASAAVTPPSMPAFEKPTPHPAPARAAATAPPAEPDIPPAVPIAGTVPAAAPVVPAEAAKYNQVWAAVCQQLEREKKRAVLSCIRNGRVVYIGDGKVIVSFKTAFMVKRATKDDYLQCVDEALVPSLGPGYHMQGFLEGDPELVEYEKKKPNPDMKEPQEAPAAPRPVRLEDIPRADRDKLAPLLKSLGDCTIYVEEEQEKK